MPTNLKLGRLPRTFDHVTPISKLRATLGASLPVLPVTLNNAKSPDIAFMFLNSTLGDCTCAGMGNAIELVFYDARAGYFPKITDAEVEKAYEAFGFNPALGMDNNPTDQGANEQDVLRWWQKTGFPTPNGRVRAGPVFEVNPKDTNAICEAIMEFGFAYIGLEIPGAFMDATSEGPPNLWTDDPSFSGIEGGHCVLLTGFDRSSANPLDYTYEVTTWGTNSQYRMRGDFLKRYVDEVWAVFLPPWVEKSGRTPYGLTEAQLAALGGEVGQSF